MTAQLISIKIHPASVIGQPPGWQFRATPPDDADHQQQEDKQSHQADAGHQHNRPVTDCNIFQKKLLFQSFQIHVARIVKSISGVMYLMMNR